MYSTYHSPIDKKKQEKNYRNRIILNELFDITLCHRKNILVQLDDNFDLSIFTLLGKVLSATSKSPLGSILFHITSVSRGYTR